MRSLKSDHAVLEEMINQLTIYLGKADLPRAFESLDLLWGSLACHIRAENICLFPAILNAPRERFGAEHNFLEYEDAKAAIDQLRNDHNAFITELAQAMKILRSVMMHPETFVTEDPVIDLKNRIVSFKELLRKHNESEEQLVYSWPALLLDEDNLAQLEVGVKTEIENLPSRLAWAS